MDTGSNIANRGLAQHQEEESMFFDLDFHQRHMGNYRLSGGANCSRSSVHNLHRAGNLGFCGVEEKVKKYQIIYADPPWYYEGEFNFPKKRIYSVHHYYPTMSLEQIKQIKIPAKKDSWLILWATATKLSEAIETLIAWGFKYRTCGIWNKGNGLGYFFRIYHEIILIGKRGNPPSPIYSEESIFSESRGKHSEKPDCVYTWIDKAFPDCSKIELFAREYFPLFPKREGWDIWGNEVNSDIELIEE